MSFYSHSSSDDVCPHMRQRDNDHTSSRPCCSSIQQYSHVPEISAFQRYAQSPTQSRSNEKATTSSHRSEKYRRSFTTYDGITTHNSGRQSVSVSCKHDDFPKTRDRAHNLRHKQSNVIDYKLMDTVHYLAQGEFAPRDDGIKLTPSREAVLSDIIWEDVCRTHWPTARLSRRRTAAERNSHRGELQKLIDGLLRERVAHVERRRRRHNRAKANPRVEQEKVQGKTGDIIVASHKREMRKRNPNASDEVLPYFKQKDGNQRRRDHKSHDRLVNLEPYLILQRDNSTSPGTISNYPSPVEPSIASKTFCDCHHNTAEPINFEENPTRTREIYVRNINSASTSTSKQYLAITKKHNSSIRKHKYDGNGTKQYVLLSTILVRNPGSKKTKKLKEYRRVINLKVTDDEVTSNTECEELELDLTSSKNASTKEIGLSTDISTFASDDDIWK